MGVMNLHVELCVLVYGRSFGEDELNQQLE